jgi:hypothetical protein
MIIRRLAAKVDAVTLRPHVNGMCAMAAKRATDNAAGCSVD